MNHVEMELGKLKKSLNVSYKPPQNPIVTSSSSYRCAIEHQRWCARAQLINLTVLSQSKISLARIKTSGRIRVGYNKESLPYAYFNRYQDLVSFDIALANKLGLDLGATVEFFPFNYQDLSESVNRGAIDIAMSAIAINEARLPNTNYWPKSFLPMQQ